MMALSKSISWSGRLIMRRIRQKEEDSNKCNGSVDASPPKIQSCGPHCLPSYIDDEFFVEDGEV